MKLAIHKRNIGKKGETKQLRRAGNVPAILYSQEGGAGTPVSVKKDEVLAILRHIQPGRLATTVFELNEGDKKHKAIVKDIQYHVANYDVVHMDFLLVSDKKPVIVNVPIQLTGVADCVGVKLGGFIRQVIRSVEVSCLPKDIPRELMVDVSKLEVAQSKRLSDLEIPSHIRPLAKMEEVVVIIGKKAGAAA
jgi:large subunit ribosomal protein L25